MKTMKRLMAYAALTAALLSNIQAASPIVIVEDLFDGYNANIAWTAVANTGGFWSATQGGLTPQIGANYYNIWNTPAWQRYQKSFTESNFTDEGKAVFGGSNDYKFLAGTYEVTMYLGLSSQDGVQFSSSGLIAYLSIMSGAPSGDRIYSTAKDTSAIPNAGEWVEWTFTFDIDENTLTENGTLVLGQSMGGYVQIQGAGTNYIAVDGFKVTYTPVPEAAHAAVLLGALVLVGVIVRRRK